MNKLKYFLTLTIFFISIFSCNDNPTADEIIEKNESGVFVKNISIEIKTDNSGDFMLLENIEANIDSISYYTNKDGEIIIDSLIKGQHSIQISNEDYFNLDSTFSVDSSNARFEFILTQRDTNIYVDIILFCKENSPNGYIPMANMEIQIDSLVFSTNQDGIVEINNIAVGNYNLKISHPDYIEVITEITVDSSNLEFEFILERVSYPIANVYFEVKAKYLDLIAPLSRATISIEGKNFHVSEEGVSWVNNVSAKEQLVSIRHEYILPFDTLIYLQDGESYYINLNFNIDSSDLDCDYFPLNLGNKWKFRTDYNPNMSVYLPHQHKYEGILSWEVMSIEESDVVRYNIREIYDGAKHTYKSTEDDPAIEYVLDTTYFNITQKRHTLTFASRIMMLSELFLIKDYKCENPNILELSNKDEPYFISTTTYPHPHNIIVERDIGIKYLRGWIENGTSPAFYEIELIESIINK